MRLIGLRTAALDQHATNRPPIATSSPLLLTTSQQSRWRCPRTGLVHFGPENAAESWADTALVLPSFRGQHPDAQGLILSQVTDQALGRDAEAQGAINNHPLCSRFVVLSTLGDGTCLLHAASMGVWGVQDQDGVLRGALRDSMRSDAVQQAVRRRFFHQLSRVRGWECGDRCQELHLGACIYNRLLSQPTLQTGLPEDDFEAEWARELQAPEEELRDLTDVHVFVLANILRRPILVYGNGQAAMAGVSR